MKSESDYMKSLTPEQKEHIRRSFEQIDSNHNGRISQYELTRAARVLGYNPTLAEAQRMIKEVDLDGNGQIEFEEFAKMMSDRYGALEYQKREIDEAFRYLDKDGNGWISYDELHSALTQGGDRLTEEEFKAVVDRLDANEDGKIYYEELADHMCRPVESF